MGFPSHQTQFCSRIDQHVAASFKWSIGPLSPCLFQVKKRKDIPFPTFKGSFTVKFHDFKPILHSVLLRCPILGHDNVIVVILRLGNHILESVLMVSRRTLVNVPFSSHRLWSFVLQCSLYRCSIAFILIIVVVSLN